MGKCDHVTVKVCRELFEIKFAGRAKTRGPPILTGKHGARPNVAMKSGQRNQICGCELNDLYDSNVTTIGFESMTFNSRF